MKNTVWIDSLCNEFHFKDSVVEKRLLYQDDLIFHPIGKLKYTDEIELYFDEGSDGIKKYYLESELNGKLVFKPIDKISNNITLFKKDSIKKPGLTLLELQIKIRPSFLSTSGVRDLTITNDKKIEYRSVDYKYGLEHTILSDPTFDQVKQYLEILKFDTYEDHYDFAGFDGANYELHIRTNLYNKTITCTQRPIEGLKNLISFIDFKLQTEKNTIVNKEDN